MNRARALLLPLALLLVGDIVGCGSTYLSSGILYYRQQNWEKAVEQLELAVKQNPQDYRAQFHLAVSLAELERYPEAAEHFALARQADPSKAAEVDQHQQSYWSKLFNAAVTAGNEGDHEGAIASYMLATEMWPEDPRAYRLLGYSYGRLGGETDEERAANMAKSIEFYEKATELDPSDVDTWRDLAATYRRANRSEDAVAAYNSALDHEPTDQQAGDIYSKLGDIYYIDKEYGTAQVMYNKAVDLIPDDTQIYYQLGLCAYNRESYEEAANFFQEAADYSFGSDDEIYEDSLYNVGLAALQANDYGRAIETAETLIDFHDGVDSYYLLRGRAKRQQAKMYEEQGNQTEADRLTNESLDDFKKAQELSEAGS